MITLIIQIVFIILKCFNLINLSWMATFTPLWIDLILYGLIKLKGILDDSYDSFDDNIYR